MTNDNINGKEQILNELTNHIRLQKDLLCQEWVAKIIKVGLLKKMTQDEIFTEVGSIYENTVEVLRTGSVVELEKYAKDLSERAVRRGVEISEATGILLLLRDILAKELFKKYGSDPKIILDNILDAYEPSANKVLNTVATSFLNERERVIRQQQETLLSLSTPLVEIWDKIVMLPLIGILDAARAKQSTEAILERIARAKTEVFVMDISGIASVDSESIGHIVRAIQAARLMGSDTIITGIRPDVATTIVTLGIDISNVVTRSTLREGLEYAYSRLGLTVTNK